jgi:uncharacterized transporter YbjL
VFKIGLEKYILMAQFFHQILKNNMQEDKNKHAQSQQGGEGRVNQNETGKAQNLNEKTSGDISNIDQQEGTMHNGRLGGNFDQDKEAKSETAS